MRLGSSMHRSFADFMGFDWPKDVAMIVNGERITYAQLLKERKEQQRKHLSRSLECNSPVRRAGFIWVFYVEGPIYGGWHLYIRSLKKDWWLHETDEIALEIMELFPCGLLPIPENFYRWKEAFGVTYARPGRFKKQALVPCWIECGYGRPKLVRSLSGSVANLDIARYSAGLQRGG